MIRTTGTIGSFHMIVLIASKARDAGSSAMSLGDTVEFLCVFRKQAKHNDVFFLFGKRTSCLAICFLFRFCGVQQLEESTNTQYHVENLMSRTFSSFKQRPYALRTFLYYYYFFQTSAPSRPNLFSITGIKVVISEIAFNRPVSVV